MRLILIIIPIIVIVYGLYVIADSVYREVRYSVHTSRDQASGCFIALFGVILWIALSSILRI